MALCASFPPCSLFRQPNRNNLESRGAVPECRSTCIPVNACSVQESLSTSQALQKRVDMDWELLSIEEGLRCLDQMDSPPSVNACLCILQTCRKCRVLAHARHLYVHLCAAALEACGVLESQIVPMFVECGGLMDAQQAFERVVDRNEYAWTYLIQGHVDSGDLQRVFELSEKMQEDATLPSKYTFVALLKACAGLGCLEKCREMHFEIAKIGHEVDVMVGRSLADMYIKVDLLEEAQVIFYQLPTRDVFLWTALMTGYTGKGCHCKALECFEKMQLEGVSPDAVTFLCSLKACSSIGAIDKGQQIHAELVKVGLEENSFAGSAVVGLYAKHGLLEEAWDVFIKLPARDSAPWNALFTGYCDHGLYQKVLDCSDQIRLEGASFNAVTFVCILRACWSMGNLIRGQEIHVEVAKEGFEKDTFVGSALMDMYTHCGLVEEAREVFTELLKRDVVTWTSLIAGYAEHGLVKEALCCLEQMQLEGVFPDAVTYACCLNVCGNANDLEKGQEFFTEIVIRGLEGHTVIECSLLQMYVSCSLLAEAQQVFDKLQSPDVSSWNALIIGYAEAALCDESLNCFKHMRNEGVAPNIFTFFACLKACESVEGIHCALEMHTEIVKAEFEGDPSIGNSLVSIYSKCGFFTEARDAFDDLLVVDVVSWAALAAGYTDHGYGYEALTCLGEMQRSGVPHDFVTYTCTSKACSSTGDIDRGRETHGHIVKVGLEKIPLVASSLIDMYTKFALLHDAQSVFDDLAARNVVSWTSLIAGYAEHELIEEIFDSLDQMHLEGVTPNALTFFYILKACSSKKAIGKSQELHAEIIARGLEDDSFITSSLVDMYIKCGLLADAQEVLEHLSARDIVPWNLLVSSYRKQGLEQEMSLCLQLMQVKGVSPDVISWNTVILCFAEHGESEKASAICGQMQERGILPDTATFVSVVKACGKASTLGSGERIYAQVCLDGGIEASELFLATTLVEMYGMCADMIKGHQVFDAPIVRDVALWNALITGYGRQGASQHVLDLFEMMREKGEQPNEITFLGALTACNHAGLLDKSQELFNSMVNDYRLTPTIKHHCCMLDLFGRAGQLHEALAMLKEIPHTPNHALWCSVLRACLEWGNVELAVVAFSCAVKLHEKHPSVFQLMSNVYASAHMWDESQNIEAMMNKSHNSGDLFVETTVSTNMFLFEDMLEIDTKCSYFDMTSANYLSHSYFNLMKT